MMSFGASPKISSVMSIKFSKRNSDLECDPEDGEEEEEEENELSGKRSVFSACSSMKFENQVQSKEQLDLRTSDQIHKKKLNLGVNTKKKDSGFQLS
jgi:hypothetical protein